MFLMKTNIPVLHQLVLQECADNFSQQSTERQDEIFLPFLLSRSCKILWMENINGKVLIFTDLHLGLKSASKSRLAICVNVIKEIIKYIKENAVKTIIFCGDWNHVRVSTENNVLNVSYKLMQALAKHAKVYCLLGNHDLYLKNSVDVNSLVIFKDIANVQIVDKTLPVSINNNLSLLVPWLGDLGSYEKGFYDMLFGHFDVSHQYLVKSYIEDHSGNNSVSDKVANELMHDDLLKTSGSIQQNAGDYIGDFVEVVKNNGTIFSGHIHGRREFLAKGRKFILVGDPYQQNLGERDNSCGFYVLDEQNNYSFHEITSTPKHVQLRMSQIIEKFESFDFSIVKGNIIHKIYDVEVDRIMDAKISQKINDWHPYEELLPDYEVDLMMNNEIKLQNESIEMIKKSKLDYVRNYIKNIDPAVLKEQELDVDKLYTVLEEYYNHVTEEK